MRLIHRHKHHISTNILFVLFLLLLGVLLIQSYTYKPSTRYVLLGFDVESVDKDQNVNKLINILDNINVSATFFITGEYADQYPNIVKKISNSKTNHEIGCHSYSHPKLTKLSYDEINDEISDCKNILESITKKSVVGFRAPYTKINSKVFHALEENNFVYDASIPKGLSLFYPNPTSYKTGEIPISTFWGVPLMDVIWLYYLPLEKPFFYILKNKNTEFESYVFHPHHIMNNEEEFINFINYLKDENVIFISHSDFIYSYGGKTEQYN